MDILWLIIAAVGGLIFGLVMGYYTERRRHQIEEDIMVFNLNKLKSEVNSMSKLINALDEDKEE